MTIPQTIIRTVEMADPILGGGVTKTATAQMTNPTPKQFVYDVELYLATDAQGINKVATTGAGAITIGPGATVPVQFTLTMPIAEAEYHVFISVKIEGTPLVLYKATETIIIVISPAIDVGPITWN